MKLPLGNWEDIFAKLEVGIVFELLLVELEGLLYSEE